MAIDPLKALEYLGYNPEEVESEEAFKESIEKTWVRRDQAHQDDEIAGRIFGKTNGTLRSKLKAQGKELGIEAKWDELDPSEGIDLLGKTLKERVNDYSTKLEEAKKGAKPGKEMEELTAKYNEAKSLSDQLKEQLGSWEKKYNDLEGSVRQREAQAKVDAQWDRAFDSLKFNEGVNKYAIEGFKQAAKGKYAVAFDDEGTPYAMEADSKKRVPNPKKAHDFLGLDDLVKQFAEAEKLTGGTPQGGAQVKKTISLVDPGGSVQRRETTVNDDGTPMKRIMPRV